MAPGWPVKCQRRKLCRVAGVVFSALFCALLVLLPATRAFAAPEVVRFASADAQGTEINGLLLKPAGKGPFAAAIMLHGCAGMLTKSGKLRKRPEYWSNWLVRRGLMVLLVDSFTPRGHGSICEVEKRPVRPDRERPYDIYGALKFLLARPEVRHDRIFLMGWSNGAMSMLWALRKDAPARPKDLPHDFRAAIGFYPGCVRLAKTAYRTNIPVLLQLGGSDDWTPAKPCQRLVDKANKAGADMRADVHPGAYHNFDHPNSKLKVITTRNSVYSKGYKQVHTGSNQQARNAAAANVAAYLDGHLATAEAER